MNIYWYISKAKLELLTQQAPSFFDGVSAKVSFKIPFLSGSIGGTETAKLVDDLKRVLKRLENTKDIKSYDCIGPDESPVLFRFQGPMVRHIEDGVFWLASHGGDVALLLAGSAAHAIGGAPSTQCVLSPSADPVSAVKALFKQELHSEQTKFGGVGLGLSSSLSYTWQALMRSDDAEGSLPTAGGIALFARAIKTDKGQIRRAGKGELGTIVIGSPLYVEQI